MPMVSIIMRVPGGKNNVMTNCLPVISCICVTRGKPDMLGRAIDCFNAQVYPHKELVIVYEDDDDATIAFLTTDTSILQHTDIRLVCLSVNPKLPLGELRNQGIQVATGEYICQWDDDDWYHANRLQEQYRIIKESRRDGSILAQWLVFDAVSKKGFISNKRLWEGSILCKKDTLLLKPYEQKAIGEDTPTIDYLDKMNLLQSVDHLPWLYIYVYHEKNTWDRAHWNYIFQCGTALRAQDDEAIAAILEGRYSPAAASGVLDEIAAHHYTRNIN